MGGGEGGGGGHNTDGDDHDLTQHHLLVPQGMAILGLVSAPPVSSQASARPSKTSPNVTLTFPPRVNTDLQSQSQVFTFPVAGCYLEGVLDGVDLIGEPTFYASQRRCHISS